MKLYISLIVLVFFADFLLAQDRIESITLSALIEQALEANPSVKIMNNRQQIANNNNSLEPFMPSVRATARQNISRTQSKIELANANATREFRDARSETFSAGVNLSWRIFDGLGMFANYDRTSLNHSISKVQTRIIVEDLVVDISDQYYRIVVQQHRLSAAQKSLDLSRERFRIITEKVNIGSASGMDLQHARLDFNADSSYLVRQKELLFSSYIRLNKLANIELDATGFVSDTIVLGAALILDELTLSALENNSSLIAANMGMKVSEVDIRLARAGRFPSLDFVTGYSYNRSESPAGVATFNQSNGINYGLEASMNIFNGFNVNRNIRNSKIVLENQQLTFDEIKLQVMADLHVLYNTYLNNLMMVDFERQNQEVSLSNLQLALERYELGVLSGLGFREFQLSYLNSVDRSLDAMYQSKVLELSLLVISGQIDEYLNRIF